MNQKTDNSLNLALTQQQEDPESSTDLATGYEKASRSWTVIVKYSGDLRAAAELGVRIEKMVNEYAIVTVPQNLLDVFAALPEIEYVEQPKRLYFSLNRAVGTACVRPLQTQVGSKQSDFMDMDTNVDGAGVLVAIPDSGIDYFHPDFRHSDGTTRIMALWDQVLGKVFPSEEINRALETGERERGYSIVPSRDLSGHGTAVAGIAAGNGLGSGSGYRGIAYESELIVIRMGVPEEDGFPRTTELMRAVNYAVEQGVLRRKPTAVNISFGNTYGSHDGSSLLETFLSDISNYGKTTIVAGSGNEGAAGGHAEGQITEETIREEISIPMSVAAYENSFSVQLWKAYEDQFEILLHAPSGEIFGPLPEKLGVQKYRYHNTGIWIYYGKPGPYSTSQEIYFDFVPDSGSYVESGIWNFIIRPMRIIIGRYDFWLPGSSVLNPSTRFLQPSPYTTLTIPSAARNVITVGAYDSIRGSYADFSGRGYTRLGERQKPDLAAPGVDIMAPAVGGGYQSVTGTSFAAPFVTGTSALFMQWGILDGNDPYLYGEKIKAYLRRGARRLPGYEKYPNPELGYGILCAYDSLPFAVR